MDPLRALPVLDMRNFPSPLTAGKLEWAIAEYTDTHDCRPPCILIRGSSAITLQGLEFARDLGGATFQGLPVSVEEDTSGPPLPANLQPGTRRSRTSTD